MLGSLGRFSRSQGRLRDGRSELVLRMRKAYQATMRQELVDAVEQITGRQVIAFLSDNHIDPDIAVEVFILEPLRPDPGAQVAIAVAEPAGER